MSISDLCASFPHNITQNRIQPVLKIGHGENPAILSAQLNSVSACFEPGELLIFSDMDADLVVRTNNSDSVSGVHVHKAIDILATLPKAYYQHKDFAAYNTLQEMIANNTPITAENDPTRSRRDSDKLNTGWKLDKYKFLAGVERAWEMRPNREWYIFYETDTYISWDGLFRLLLTQNGAFDPDKEIYLGSPSPGRRTWFANGGPGFVLSRGAMRRLLARKAENGEKGIGVGMGMTRGWFEEQSLTEKWMTAVQGDCCGDSVLGWALWKAGVKLGGLFPMFNVYPAHGVVYTEHMWCQPLVTLHKTTPRDMVELWRWEQGHRRLGRPILYADLYAFKNPGLLPGSSPSKSNNLNPRRSNDLLRPNWDNTAYDRLAPAHDVHAISPAQCAVECDKDPACLQYLHRGETCVLMPYIVYGAEKLPEVNERNVTDESNPGGWRMETETIEFTAGWMGGRIKGWRREHECKEVDWLWPSLDRYF
ncbi:beta-1,3-N-acetylglucosaminyltransferase radical fringe [Naviculisporaceae sp. PSN 640]